MSPPSPPADAVAPSWRAEALALLRLAGPIALVQVGFLAMGLVDTLVVGHVSEAALAAVALGHLYTFALLSFGMGALAAVDPLVSQALGAGDGDAVRRAVQRGLVLAVVVTAPAAVGMLVAGPVLRVLGQPESILELAAGYSRISAAGALPLLFFMVLRIALQGMHRTRAILGAVILGNVVNAALDWVLVFGAGGVPAMGPLGSAWATVATRWLMLLVLLLGAWPLLSPCLVPVTREAMRWPPLVRVARLGFPIGVQHVLEMGAFSAVALFMGWIGTRELASHQIAIQLASLTFMVPLGISMAAAVRVGRAVGAGRPAAARRSSAVSLLCGGGVMMASGVVFLAVPELLASAFSNDAGVVAGAASLVRIAAVFQVFDGVQVVAIGVLRGTGDTRTPVVVNVVGFALVGIPASLWLGFGAGLGAEGLWWGLVIGLVAVAAILLVRVRLRLAGTLLRLDVDSPTA